MHLHGLMMTMMRRHCSERRWLSHHVRLRFLHAMSNWIWGRFLRLLLPCRMNRRRGKRLLHLPYGVLGIRSSHGRTGFPRLKLGSRRESARRVHIFGALSLGRFFGGRWLRWRGRAVATRRRPRVRRWFKCPRMKWNGRFLVIQDGESFGECWTYGYYLVDITELSPHDNLLLLSLHNHTAGLVSNRA